MSVLRKLGALTASGLSLGLGLVIAASAANAAILPLTVYNDNGTPTDFAAEVEMTCYVGGCDMTFTNTSDTSGVAGDSAIDKIYFEDGFANYFSTASITGDTGTVNFVEGTVTPGTKPQALSGWSGTWSEGYFVRDGNKDDGINALGYDGADDSLTISLAFLNGGFDATALAQKILNIIEDMMVAIHVNECAPDTSCNAYATPIPAAIWLLGSALLGLFGFGAVRRSGAT